LGKERKNEWEGGERKEKRKKKRGGFSGRSNQSFLSIPRYHLRSQERRRRKLMEELHGHRRRGGGGGGLSIREGKGRRGEEERKEIDLGRERGEKKRKKRSQPLRFCL